MPFNPKRCSECQSFPFNRPGVVFSIHIPIFAHHNNQPVKPSIPKGTRDFTPAEMARRNHILGVVTRFFKLYGYQQIETPAMENIGTLTGKYGDEGDQLLYKVLNSRIHESKKKDTLLKTFGEALEKNINSELLTERALRYDLTVPFARYVVMHQHEITFPFKRFQIQPVWRADRPQKGRYREFYQCDADVIGSHSLLNEIDLVLLVNDIFGSLGVDVTIKINNRKVLSGIAEIIGQQDKIIPITVALDKLDKAGISNVIEELQAAGLTVDAISKLKPLLEFKGDNRSKISLLRKVLANSETGMKGIDEIEFVFDHAIAQNLEFDITLARGLNYYTGAIFEVKANAVNIGSISGGGRYDDLTGIFGLPGVSGVGISFGVDRIYDVMEELKLFDNASLKFYSTKVLIANFGAAEQKYCLKLLSHLRESGIHAEYYPDNVKLKKQLAYADANRIPFVVMAGSEEIQSGKLTLKNMNSGEQIPVSADKIPGLVSM